MRNDDTFGVVGGVWRGRCPRRAALIAYACTLAAIGAGGCSSDAPKGSATLEPTAFKSPDQAAPTSTPQTPIKATTHNEAAAGFLDITSLPGAPSTLSPSVAPVGDEVMVDQFIGQVNGRAIMASEFFGDGFGERLRAMGQDEQYIKAPRDWNKKASEMIEERLFRRVRDDILLDEAYAAMTPEVKAVGLRHFMDQLRGDFVRRNQGSEALTDEATRTSEGKTFDEFLREKLDDEITGSLLHTKVSPRVNVSWQQVRDAYEREYESRKDVRIAKFLVLSLPEKSPAAAATKADLESGKPFMELYSAAPDDLQLTIEKQYKGDAAKANFFHLPQLNEPARQLTPGATTPPIAFDGKLYWIHLESVSSPAIPSLYEAQLAILDQLVSARTSKERAQYIHQLMAKSSHTPMLDMRRSLQAIAVARYAPTPPAAPAQPAARVGKP